MATLLAPLLTPALMKLLAGSYYSQTVDIFAALIAGSVVAILLVTAVDIVGRIVNARMGARHS